MGSQESLGSEKDEGRDRLEENFSQGMWETMLATCGIIILANHHKEIRKIFITSIFH